MEKTPNEMIRELYIVLMGVPHSDDRGVVGDVKDIKQELRYMNGCIRTNTTWRKAFCFIIPMLAGALGFLAGAMFL